MGVETTRTIQSLDRAVAILDLLATRAEGLSLSRIASRMDLRPQTVQGLLRTLQAHELVAQAARGAPYVLGPRVHQLSRQWLAGHDRGLLARPIVAELSAQIDEYVLLAELRGESLIHLAVAAPDRSLMVRPGPATAGRLHAMATGKLLMAHLPAARRNALVNSLTLRKLGPRTVTSRAALLRQLEQIHHDGLVVCIEEMGQGIAALAVTVADASGEPVAALGVALPLARFASAARRKLQTRLRRAAAKISRVWGD